MAALPARAEAPGGVVGSDGSPGNGDNGSFDGGVPGGGGGGSAGGGLGGQGAVSNHLFLSGGQFVYARGGNGGQGGENGGVLSTDELSNESSLSGSDGASGFAGVGDDVVAGGPGGGGEGGYGLILTAGDNTGFTNYGDVTGGKGGTAGPAPNASPARPATAGDGGIALDVLPTGVTIYNLGSLQGGDAGGYQADHGGDGTGLGGAGLQGSGLTLVNYGSITAGHNGDETLGYALHFTGGSNALALSPDSVLTGGIAVDFGAALFFDQRQGGGFGTAFDSDVTISNVISGDGSIAKSYGSNLLTLSGANTYTGGTYILGNIDLASASAAGTGAITFAVQAQKLTIERVALDSNGNFGNDIVSFMDDGDVIDLRGISGTSTASFDRQSGTLTLEDGGISVATLHFGAGGYDGLIFRTAADSDDGGVHVTVNAVPPFAVTARLANDTGQSNTDGITSDPTITGQTTPGASVSLFDRYGNGYGDTTADDHGVFFITPVDLAEGFQFLTVRANLDGQSGSQPVNLVLDRTAPAAPASAPVLANDTGAADGVTSNPAITYPNPADGDTLLYSLNGGPLLATMPSITADGTYSVAVAERDAAGNVGPSSATLTFTLDTTAPAAPASAPVLANDTGAADGVTSNPAITYPVPADGDTLLYSLNGGPLLATMPSITADGTYSVAVAERDAAGNVGPSSATLTFTLDTTAPAAPASAPVLANDTGAADGVTSNPAITYPNPADGDTLLYSLNGGPLLATMPSITADGTYSVAVAERDAAGNVGPSSATLTFTLDTTAPAAPASAPVLANDTGAADGVTSNPAITYPVPADGDTLLYSLNGGPLLATMPSITADGTYSVAVAERDAAGNVGPSSATLTFTLDTTAPAAPASAPVLANDTGAADGVTSNPAITYPVPADGDTLLYSLNGGPLLATMPSITADGTYSVAVAERDAAGNVGPSSATLTFTLDTTAPAAPASAPVLANDTGAADGVTSNPAITYPVPADGDTLLYSLNGGPLLATMPSITADGTYSVAVAERDAAGNVGPSSATLTFTLDTTAPAAPASAPVLANDTGAADGVTSNPAITYPNPADGDTLLYSLNGGPLLATMPSITADGTYSVAVAERDAAGNVGPSSATLTFTLDTTAPAAPASAPVLANDTGAADGVTSNPAITYPVPADGDTLLYSLNGGPLLATMPSITADGTYSVAVAERDAAGNVGPSSATLTFTLDTTAPAAPASAPVLANDTGAADGVTSNPAITYPVPADGDTLLYSLNGGPLLATMPSITADGTYSVAVAERDAAGNVGPSSATLTFTLDTTAPAAPASAPVLANDTGAADGVTSNPAITYPVPADGDTLLYSLNGGPLLATMPSFTTDGTYSVAVAERDAAGNVGPSSATLTFTLDTTAPAAPASAPVLANDTGAADGVTSNPAITYPVPADGDTLLYSLNGGPLLATMPSFPTDGTYSVAVAERDAAGNVGPSSATLTFTLDTTAPAAPASAPVLANDTGAADGVTSNPAITYPVPADGDTLLYSLNGGPLLATMPSITADGTYSLAVAERDAAGNVGPSSATLTFTLDTTAPAAPASAPVLANDTGAADGVTSNPAITYPVPADGDTLLYSLNGGPLLATMPSFTTDGTYSVAVAERDAAGNVGPSSATLTFTLDTTAPAAPASAPVLANDTGAADGVTSNPAITYPVPADGDTLLYSLNGGPLLATMPSFTTDGTYSMAVAERDAAGNVGPSSATLTFTLDTTAPAAPASAPVLANDTGAADGVTSNPAITYPVPADGDTLLYSLNGGPLLATMPSFTTDGTYMVAVAERDAAGNVGPSSATLTFTLDTTAPAAPASAPVLANDTGAADGVTSNPAITYPVPADGDTLLYSLNGGPLLATMPSFTTDGTYSVAVAERDAAGNVGPSSATLTFTLDTTAPAAPASAPVLANDTGAADGVTSNPAITYPVPADGDTLLYSLNGGPLLATMPSFTTDGTYSVAVAERDAAGNVGPSSATLTFTLDTTAPAAPASAPVLANDTGAADGVTSNPAITYPVPADGDTLLYSLNGGPLLATMPSITADGTYSLAVAERDAAGNVGPSSATLTFTLDTTAPAAPASAPVLANDTGAADGVTSNPAITYPVPADGDTLLYSLNGGPLLATMPSFTTDGTYSVAVAERDAAGNVGPSSATLTFTLDTTAPAAPASAPVLANDTGAADGVTSNPAITYPVPADGDTLLYSLNGGPLLATMPSFTTDGTYMVAVAERDAAGNVGPSSATLTFTLDTTAPAAVSIAGVSGATNLVDMHTVSGSVDAGLEVTVRDGATVLGTVASDSSGHFDLAFTDTADGTSRAYHLTASATDGSGHTATSANFDFTLDFTPNQPLFGSVTHDANSPGGEAFAFYDAFLGRTPDALGLEAQADPLVHGASLHDVALGFLNSNEFTSEYGGAYTTGSDDAFVQYLYHVALGRAPDAQGEANQDAFLAAGGSRVDLAVSFALSTENLGQIAPALQAGVFVADPTDSNVARLYFGLLGRAPDAGGLQNGETALHNGLSESALAQGFLNSLEFAALHPTGQTDMQFVDALYVNALGRQADQPGEAGWVDALASHTLDRAGVALGIAESAEAHLHLVGQIEAGWHLA